MNMGDFYTTIDGIQCCLVVNEMSMIEEVHKMLIALLDKSIINRYQIFSTREKGFYGTYLVDKVKKEVYQIEGEYSNELQRKV